MNKESELLSSSLYELGPKGVDFILRENLAAFIQRSFSELDPGTTCLWNWHLDLIADRLTRVASGEIRRLIIAVPPRSLKSICASVAFPAWLLGHMPHKRVICASYGQELANKLGRDSLTIMQSAWYKRLFPHSSPTRTAAADIETASHGCRMATSIGGVLTGRGGDVLIIDDPTKPDEVLSDTLRASANDWYDNTLSSRLNDKRTGAIILIMQRQHLDDMIGHVSSKGEHWDVVKLPAIASEEECWHYQTVLGARTQRRVPGAVLHPQREPREVLDQLRHAMGTYVFEAQYLQSPVPLGGGLVKEAWIHRYAESDLPTQFDGILQSWDTASKESELSDYSVCSTWGFKDKRAYLLHVLRKRLDYPTLKREVVAQQANWKATTVLIEDRASGIQLVQELRSECRFQVIPISPVGDKVMRMQAQTWAIENGSIRYPNRAPWLDTYLVELTSFPQTRYRDQVDSTSQAIAWLSEIWRSAVGVQVYTDDDPGPHWRDDMDDFMGGM
jgi:predicted phage terminase large subunit-like protein